MMVSLKSYRDLVVWQKGMDLVVECYRITNLLPKNETYGLASQIQRAAVSIPTLLKGTVEIILGIIYITYPWPIAL